MGRLISHIPRKSAGPTKGRAMILFILLPLLSLASAVGVYAMKFEDPDRVASNYSPYVEIGR